MIACFLFLFEENKYINSFKKKKMKFNEKLILKINKLGLFLNLTGLLKSKIYKTDKTHKIPLIICDPPISSDLTGLRFKEIL